MVQSALRDDDERLLFTLVRIVIMCLRRKHQKHAGISSRWPWKVRTVDFWLSRLSLLCDSNWLRKNETTPPPPKKKTGYYDGVIFHR